MSTLDTQERYIALLARSGDTEAFAAGETVFAEGDPGELMYIVSSGTVSFNAHGQSSRRSARAASSASWP